MLAHTHWNKTSAANENSFQAKLAHQYEILSSTCYNSSYASSLIVMLMTMLMTILKAIIDYSSLEHKLVSKSTLFRVSLCSFESYK